MNKERFITLTLIVLAAAASRLLPHPTNVAPITALALFGGAYFERKWMAFAVPLFAMFLSDALIGFHESMAVVYLAFCVVVLFGFALRRYIHFASVLGASLAGSITFFLITNFALWLPYDLYPHTAEGVMQSYIAALPFFQNTLLGDLFYSALLFGGFAMAERHYPLLRVRPNQAA